MMDFGSMLDESLSYAKERVWGKWIVWLKLLACMIIFPFILGYMVRIYRGEKPAPELNAWGSMFIDGLKLLVIDVIYAAPVILLVIIAFIPMISTLITSGALSQDFAMMSETQMDQWFMSHPEFFTAAGWMIMLFLVALLLAMIISIFSFLGSVRFARTGLIAEAFNFSAILSRIHQIGWINYILALLIIGVIGIIFGMMLNIFALIPVIGEIMGMIIFFVLYVPFIIFSSRYAVLVYEQGNDNPEDRQTPENMNINS